MTEAEREALARAAEAARQMAEAARIAADALRELVASQKPSS